MGVAHEVLQVPAPPGEDEPQHAGESATDYVVRTARERPCADATGCRPRAWRRCLLSADTTVILAGAVLGKPADRADAERILRALSGATHEVRTALWAGDGLREAVSVTQVSMRALDAEDIARYCDSGEPYGKAGAYGVQGLAGAFVASLSGSYTGVMGLPVFETAALLRAVGIRIP